MRPNEVLMIEHRLIERMISLMREELKQMTTGSKTDMDFMGSALDFLRTYADITHQGKEDILFSSLDKKGIPDKLKKIMADLIDQHNFLRKVTANLAVARTNYLMGNRRLLEDITRYINEIVRLYPIHMDREENEFFPAAMEHYSASEQNILSHYFSEFDQRVIHDKYQQLVCGLEEYKKVSCQI